MYNPRFSASSLFRVSFLLGFFLDSQEEGGMFIGNLGGLRSVLSQKIALFLKPNSFLGERFSAPRPAVKLEDIPPVDHP